MDDMYSVLAEVVCMRDRLRLSVVLVSLIAGAFVFVTHETQANSEPVDILLFQGVNSPRSLYVQNCARCHGANGRAQTALGKKLEADDLTRSTADVAKIIRTITNGRGDMPSFRKKLTAAQIASIAGWVKSL